MPQPSSIINKTFLFINERIYISKGPGNRIRPSFSETRGRITTSKLTF
jgi:hypothetical protein